MASRGRPVFSKIRQNLIEILFFKGKAYGYELHKLYNQIFPKCTNRVIYYHLKKGVDLEEFKLEKVEVKQGDYSWGTTATLNYYSLGKNAKPKIERRVKDALDKIKSEKK